MKIKTIIAAVCAVVLASSCSIMGNSSYLSSNENVHQTNVVLSQDNFEVVKSVSAEATSTYIFGIGGLSKKALKANAVAELTKNAELKGSQALVNVTVKQTNVCILGIYLKATYLAEGTVVEFK